MALSKGPYLFCEGGENSLDKELLNRIAGPAAVQVKPIGSKYGFSHRIDGYLQGTGITDTRTVAYIALRDRDLDYHIPDTSQLISDNPSKTPPNQKIFATYRACIESYLIDADLLYEYWDYCHKGLRNQPPAPLPVADIERLIIEAAQSIAAYQAIRWALASPRPKKPPYTLSLSTSWKKDGDLPNQLEFDSCLNEAQEFFNKEYLAHPLKTLTWEQVEKKAHEFQSRFAGETFYQSNEHLVWFHGKDLMKAIFREFRELEIAQLGQDQYERWAVQHLDYTRHADLSELNKRSVALH